MLRTGAFARIVTGQVWRTAGSTAASRSPQVCRIRPLWRIRDLFEEALVQCLPWTAQRSPVEKVEAAGWQKQDSKPRCRYPALSHTGTDTRVAVFHKPEAFSGSAAMVCWSCSSTQSLKIWSAADAAQVNKASLFMVRANPGLNKEDD